MPAEFPASATSQKKTVFLVEAVQPEVSDSKGDENVDIVIPEVYEGIQAKIDKAVPLLRAKGVQGIAVEVIGHSAIVHLQHTTYYHVGLVISALKGIGDVTIHFPDRKEDTK